MTEHAASVRQFHQHQADRLDAGDLARVTTLLVNDPPRTAPSVGDTVRVERVSGGLVYPEGYDGDGWDAVAFEKVEVSK